MNEIKKINVDGVDYDIVTKELTKITYAELKALRDTGELIEGHLYRITDYVTTTTQTNTKSAGNVFDVIVLATSTNELSHIARAIQHEGDTYFDGNDLGAWELWYDLDNDTEKYEWADATNGKGVIYRMIDEKRNDCPYDFKNILFYNDKYTHSTTTDKYYYTFSYVVNRTLYDGTVEKQVKYCYSNSMGVRISSNKRKLLFNVFHNNTFGTSCYNNTFGTGCYNHTFGTGCFINTFGTNCHNNTFGTNCYYNTFGPGYHGKTLGAGSYDYKVESEKTMSEEFYDDGSGQLVPIKHPDLSTQPSILPYKFMGQYVYEILLPIHDINRSRQEYTVNASQLLEYVKDLYSVAILQAEELLFCHKGSLGSYTAIPMFVHRNVSIYTSEQHGGTAHYNLIIRPDNTDPGIIGSGEVVKAYLRIVYTSMPEEGGYYGYNNY